MRLGTLLVVGAVAVLSTASGNDRASGGAPQVATSLSSVFLDSLPLPPGPIIVGKKGLVTAGDTLAYTISWGPGARATSYNVTIAATLTNGAWAVVRESSSTGGVWTIGTGIGPLATTANITPMSYKTWLSAISWDSVTFTVSVASRNAIGTSSSVATSWKVLRKPGPPGPITIDSSLIVIGALVRPATGNIFLGSSRVVCAFQVWGNGAVTQSTVDKPSCDSIYVSYVSATARALVQPVQQAHTDSLSKTCVTWAGAPLTTVTVMPLANCSFAARVTGIGLTLRFPADASHYGGRAEGRP